MRKQRYSFVVEITCQGKVTERDARKTLNHYLGNVDLDARPAPVGDECFIYAKALKVKGTPQQFLQAAVKRARPLTFRAKASTII